MDIDRMKQERIARATAILVVAALIAVLVWGLASRSNHLVLTGNMPENGGWQPGIIEVEAGESLKLRLTSADVVHGFAVGQMDGTETEVHPGKFTEFTITIHEPGTYTYYCTRWCGPNHWRMRGTIEVEGELPVQENQEKIPLYLQLGIDIDAPHEADVLPPSKPSAHLGKSFLRELPEAYFEPENFFTLSPAEFFLRLRAEENLTGVSDQEIWHLIAALYEGNATKEELISGQQLYNENCAACHGMAGGGDGIFANANDQLETPTDFRDPKQMLGANSALLQGKIIRGGMGTGMPYWGTIFTEDQTWSLVKLLWSFQFDYYSDK